MDQKVKKIITKVRKGDHQAFAELVNLYKTQVYNICLRLVRIPQEAEDLAQEAFIRAYTNIDKYEIDRKFSTWLFRIATNLSIDYLRKKKPSAYLDAEIPGTDGFTMYTQLASEEPLPEDLVLEYETQEWVQREIEELPAKYRSAIVLKYIQDLSLKEISDILDIPVATVKTRIHRGREALRKRLRHV
ncbi:RNA polymerase sigma (SigW) subunit [Scopulibacillus darangshiensis]|uniref:RNA polymerase sigma factor n=1 Tax=Scopulibacillus darangshiensis TaxID=442528 RepID=A0A4R2P264_9BACL|nr:RNA polymerase sigma factor SigW [Scopulibacillus darangshiensis]TCP28809.1 RNA polymerase sigma (SigW) subunit [Scopulibacillus darangshiensis]